MRSDRLAIVAFSGAPRGAAANGAGPPQRELVTVAACLVRGYMSGARVAAASGAERLSDGAGARSYATTDDDALEPVNPATRSLASYSGHAIAASSLGLPCAADEENDGLHTRRSRRIVGCDGEYHRRHPVRAISIPPSAYRRYLPSSPARAARRHHQPYQAGVVIARSSPPSPSRSARGHRYLDLAKFHWTLGRKKMM
uniref:Uncharacterized protein n=1 Tax=Oryza glumipatula TaxID=40148 RepID=A0A0E0A958_9ORYZ